MLQLNYKHVKATNEVFKRLNRMRRWTNVISQGIYNELAKQALNCIIAYFLACYAENAGASIVWSRFPRIALYRAFQKTYVAFNTPEYKYNEIFEISGINKSKFNEATIKKISAVTDDEFANFLNEATGTLEEKIYKAATKIATYIEFLELGRYYSTASYSEKLVGILEEIHEYDDVCGMDQLSDTSNPIFKLLQFISGSGLRHHVRWCECGYLLECTILGHLFDTGCFAYIMSLEEDPLDEKLAADRFFMGIFHDIAEAWTTDIPSPLKDFIPGFRSACEQYEDKNLEENLYAVLPDFLKERVRDVMFEDPKNISKHKAIIKGADYLSADSECWRQYVLGSRDPYFIGAMERRLPGIETGKVALPPICKQLFQYFRTYAARLNLDDLDCDLDD